jgi:hypothetical protein
VSDIFVSYASADRDRARAVAQALTDQGWAVWWDRTIPPGRQFDEVIEEALDSARCVVVLWSKASVASQWVKTEAAEAMRRKILVPVLIEEVKIPLEFRRLQAADLSTWTGGNTHEEVQKFFASIATNVGHPGTPPPSTEIRPPKLDPAGVKPLPQPPPEPPLPPPQPPVARTKSKALLLGAAGLASLVVIAVGYTAYNERVKRQAMEERAERERKAAEEARRAAEESAARAKLAQEAAAKEAAQRRAEQERRAADDARRAAESAAAARAVKAAQEDAARAKAAQEAAARDAAARDAAVRAKAAQEQAARQQAAAKQGTTTMRINWYDHALRFNGTLSGKPSSASLQATIYDIKTGAQIGNYDVPAIVTKQGDDFVVTGTFQVPRDSVTPNPHSHTSRLLLRRQSDGSLRYVENCPQAGKQCYR